MSGNVDPASRSSSKLGWIPSIATATLLTLCVVGCGGNEPEELTAAESAPVSAPEPRVPKNCLLIVLDAFHAKHVTHLGYPRETTPKIDALANQGVSFSNAYSQSPVTLGSTVSFMSGQYLPIPHQNNFKYTLNGCNTTLAEAFHQSGFATAGYSENPYVRRRGGFGRGFDEFRMRVPLLPPRPAEDFRRRDEQSTIEFLDEAGGWIESKGDERWFCYMHLLRPHDPYISPAPYAGMFRPEGDVPGDEFRPFERTTIGNVHYQGYVPTEEEIQRLKDVYDGSIAYIDSLMDGFLARLRAAGALDDTLVVIYSDHGEAFYEHKRFKHSSTVYNEMIHVPMVFLPPADSGWTHGVRDEVVELVDLYPTLAELFELQPAQAFHGTSLVPALLGADAPDDQTLYSQTPTADQIAFREGSQKLIFWDQGDGLELVSWFDVDQDPDEQNNLFPDKKPPDALRERAEETIRTYFVPPAGGGEDLEDEQEEMLRALGYVE